MQTHIFSIYDKMKKNNFKFTSINLKVTMSTSDSLIRQIQKQIIVIVLYYICNFKKQKMYHS